MRLTTFAMAITLGIAGLAQAQTPDPTSINRTLSSEAWRQDLAIMAREMEKVHKDLYHSVPRERFAAAVAELDARISTATRGQIIVGMMRIAAMVGDGHTNVSPHRDAAIAFPSLPIRLYLFSDGLYIRAAAPRYASLVGARVEAIGGVPVADAVSRVSTIIAHDNESGLKAFVPIYLGMPDILNALGLSASSQKASLTLSAGKKRWTVVLPAGEVLPLAPGDTEMSLETPAGWADAAPKRPLWLQDANTAFRLVPLPAERAVYVQLNRVGDTPNETLAAFGTRIRHTVETSRATRLILDLRLDRGGGGHLIPPFVRELIRANDDDTQLFVLIGRSTFSAAQFLTDDLDRFSNAVLVGEPTGSKPNAFGDSRKIVLPNSGITVRASIYWWQQDQDMTRQDTQPQVAAPLSFVDYAAGRDPALEAALAFVPTEIRRKDPRLTIAPPTIHVPLG